jgi:hypothetical protein
MNATSSNMKMVPVAGSKPPGIGLHLNSIVNAMPPSRTSTSVVRLSDGLQGIQSKPSISLHKVESVTRSSVPSNVDGQSFIARNESRETDASVVADSFISESPILKESIDLYPANTHDKKRVSPAEVEIIEESNHRSTSKKKSVIMIFLIVHIFLFFTCLLVSPNITLFYRKKTSADDTSGPKSCNCKKSKCLKL